jgi:hypothetical protein
VEEDGQRHRVGEEARVEEVGSVTPTSHDRVGRAGGVREKALVTATGGRAAAAGVRSSWAAGGWAQTGGRWSRVSPGGWLPTKVVEEASCDVLTGEIWHAGGVGWRRWQQIWPGECFWVCV